MHDGDVWNPPPSPRRKPRIPLLEPVGLSPEQVEARNAGVRAMVAAIREQYAHNWPATGVGRARARALPWPECWEDHPGFVAELRMLKTWHDAIEAGEAEGGHREARDWLTYLRTDIASDAREIMRLCRYGHIDIAAPRTPPQPVAPGPPSLPWQEPADVPPSAAPVVRDWAGYFTTTRPPVGPAMERDLVEL
jgi:hypothetical protein